MLQLYIFSLQKKLAPFYAHRIVMELSPPCGQLSAFVHINLYLLALKYPPKTRVLLRNDEACVCVYHWELNLRPHSCQTSALPLNYW